MAANNINRVRIVSELFAYSAEKRQGLTLNDDVGCAAYSYYRMLVLLNDPCEDNITKNGAIYCHTPRPDKNWKIKEVHF
jgi:hypothetical protein